MLNLPQFAPIPTPRPAVGPRVAPAQANQDQISLRPPQPQQQPQGGAAAMMGGLGGLGGMAPSGGSAGGGGSWRDIIAGLGVAISSPGNVPAYVEGVLNQRRESEQRNATMAFLQKNAPEMVEMVQAGLPAGEAFKAVLSRRQQEAAEAKRQQVLSGIGQGGQQDIQAPQGEGMPAQGGGQGGQPVVTREGLMRMMQDYSKAYETAGNDDVLRDILSKKMDWTKAMLGEMSDARPMSAEERAQWGIPQEDTRPYMMSDDGPKLIGGSGVTVQNNIGGEKAWDTESAKLFAKKYDDISSGAMKANEMLGMYDLAEQALATGVRTGLGGEAELSLRRLGETLGIDTDPAKIAGGELIRAVQNRMALTMRSPDGGMGMPGALSDRDIQFLKDSQVGIDRTPEGNKRMLESFRKMEQRKIEISQLADQYIEKNGRLDSGFNTTIREYAKANPLFTSSGNDTGQTAPGGATSRPTATNPETGEKLQWNGQAWEPAR